MPREKAFWALLLSFSILGFIVSVTEKRVHVVEQSFLGKSRPVSQGVKRTWKNVHLVQEKNIGTRPPSRLVNPLRVYATKEHIFVLDWGDRAIKKFDRDGAIVQLYRAWDDRPPSEPLVPTHFSVSQRGEVWVCYQHDHLVKVFSGEGELLHNFRVKPLPHRVVPMVQGGFVVMGGDPGPELFQRYDKMGRFVGSFGRIVAGKVQHPLVLDGWVASSENLTYASRYAGILASYSPAGNLIYLVQTIDPSPLPSLWVSGNGRWKVEPGSSIKSLGLSVSDGKLYVMSERESTAIRNRILDVYRESNGSYLYSIRLSQPASHAVVVGSTMYTVDNERVVRWKIED